MDSAVAYAAELERRDAVLDERLSVLADLGRRVDATRVEAERIVDVLERLPREREQLDATLVEADRELAAAHGELANARRTLERARGDDAAVRRREAIAATDVRTTDDRRARLVAHREELVQAEVAARDELRVLDARGRELAGELEVAPRVAAPDPPSAGLEGLVDWASRAHAAVFVARSGLEAERERVVREANELAASVLGEPLHTTSVAVVRERLEELGS